jgi:transcriptional regulator with XRE-family HTH domain
MILYVKTMRGKDHVMIMIDKISFRNLRQRSGFKQTKLAQEAGVSVQSIYRLEIGRSVSIELVNALLLVINRKLGTAYAVSDLDGVNLAN